MIPRIYRTFGLAALASLGAVLAVSVVLGLGLVRLPVTPDRLLTQWNIPPGEASLEQGVAEYFRRNDAHALAILLPHAERGDAEAQNLVGFILADGVAGNASPDHCAAAFWLEQAARAGVPAAQVRFAELLLRGVGVPKNELLGEQWLDLGARGLPANEFDAYVLSGYVNRVRPNPATRGATSASLADLAATPQVSAKPALPRTFLQRLAAWRQGCHADTYVRDVAWQSIRCCRCGPVGKAMTMDCELPLPKSR